MKRLTALLLILALVLCGCKTLPPETTTAPPATIPLETTQPTEPEPTAPVIAMPRKSLIVHYIDVGHADCILLECENSYALIDAGYDSNGADVVKYLQSRGVQRLNLVVGTHAHGDHIGGLETVLKTFPADNIWSGPITYSNSVVESFLRGAKRQNKEVITPEIGQKFYLGSAEITVLGPVRDDYEDVNDLSLVLMVQYGDTRFLFTGDMERVAELDLIDSGADLKADVLKVGHHGSYSSTSYVFLWNVMPKYGIISLAADNEYGHPHRDPMSRLKDAEVEVYRTDTMGTVIAVSNGKDIAFTWKNPYGQPWNLAA